MESNYIIRLFIYLSLATHNGGYISHVQRIRKRLTRGKSTHQKRMNHPHKNKIKVTPFLALGQWIFLVDMEMI